MNVRFPEQEWNEVKSEDFLLKTPVKLHIPAILA